MRRPLQACLILIISAAWPNLAAGNTPEFPAAAEYIQGVHYSPRSSRTITRVVIHTIEGSAKGAISWFRNSKSKVSAHYIVDKYGRVTQMIKEKDIAWHAGNWTYNKTSLGIENEGYAGKNHWTEDQYRSLAKLTRYMCDKYKIPIDRSHIIGHKEVPNQSHWDPGPHFKWDYFIHLVKTSGSGSTPPPPPPDPTPDPTPPPSSVKTPRVTASRLNVRTGAWGSILGQTRSGLVHASDESSGSWTRIHWRGRKGYIYRSYTTESGSHAVKVLASRLNVRYSPGVTSSNRVGRVYRSQLYREITRSGSWVKIQYDHRTEWVHGSYVTRIK